MISYVIYGKIVGMTTNDFYGAALVLTDATNASKIAAKVAATYFPDSEYHFEVTESIPENLPEDITKALSDELLFVTDESVVLTVYLDNLS